MVTEKRLIDANELRTQFDDIPPYIGLAGSLVQQYIDKAPTVDAVEVVRCKYCRYRNELEVTGGVICDHEEGLIGTNIKDTDFCPYGERRTYG